MDNKFDVNELIKSRAKFRGDFEDVANVNQDLLQFCSFRRRYKDVALDVELTALQMIMHKIARILTANGYDEDSWKDVAGYATLVVNHYKQSNEAQ